MANSTFDIWAIQHYPEEIHTAIAQLKDSPTNILFENCVSRLRIGHNFIDVQFPTVFYSEDSDVSIYVMRDSGVTDEEFKELLTKKGISFNTVSLHKSETEKKNTFNRELWFAREEYVLCDALADSKKNGITACEYYPAITGNLDIGYSTTQDDEEIMFDSQPIRGMVVLADKIVLFVQHGEDRNINYYQALKLISKSDMAVSICEKQYLPRKEREKQFVKGQ